MLDVSLLDPTPFNVVVEVLLSVSDIVEPDLVGRVYIAGVVEG